MPGVWREAWAGGRQLGVGGWDRKWGPGGGGVRVSHRLGRGLYLVGTAASYGRKLRTHMFLATNSHMCIHMHCARVDMIRDWGLKTLGLYPSPPSTGLLVFILVCGFGAFFQVAGSLIPCSFQ